MYYVHVLHTTLLTIQIFHGNIVLKLHCSRCSSKVKDTIDVRISIVEVRLDLCVDQILYRALSSKVLIIMAWIQAPYIHVILADVVSIT